MRGQFGRCAWSPALVLLLAVVTCPCAVVDAAKPSSLSAARIERTVERLPPGFAGAEAETFFWSLPGAKSESDSTPMAAADVPVGTYAFRVRLRPDSTPPGECVWRVGPDAAGKQVLVKVSSHFEQGEICLAISKTNRQRPRTSPSGEMVTVTESYEKLFSLKTKDAGDLESMGQASAGKDLEISVQPGDQASLPRLLGGGLGALVVLDVMGTPDFKMDEGPPSAESGPTRRNTYLIMGDKPEVWLFDTKSRQVLLKKVLHP